jgi:threonine/homoserine/homoserine lactone efflux protein
MPPASDLLLFMAAALALNVTPGPDMLYVIGRGTADGRRAGIVSALGIGAGTLVHIAAVALGLSALLVRVPLAFDAIRWAGAAYLAWLGVRSILSARGGGGTSDGERALPPATLGAIFRQGVITNVLNPKVALFFLAFLPQFVDPAAGPPALQVALLGLMFDASGTIVLLIVAYLASGAVAWARRGTPGGRRGSAMLSRITGILFIGFAVRLALSTRR